MVHVKVGGGGGGGGIIQSHITVSILDVKWQFKRQVFQIA